jgi:hypothetical protein
LKNSCSAAWRCTNFFAVTCTVVGGISMIKTPEGDVAKTVEKGKSIFDKKANDWVNNA